MGGAGDLDRRVALRRTVRAPDAYGELVPVWEALGTVWAGLRESGGMARETEDAGEERAAIQRRTFVVRWSAVAASLTGLDGLTFEGRDYDIVGVKQIGRRYRLSIEAVARAD